MVGNGPVSEQPGPGRSLTLTLTLRRRWDGLAGEHGWPDGSAAAVGSELVQRWGEPQRHYHTEAHLLAVLDVLERLCAPRPPRLAALLAAWFHDAIYDPLASDNEARSAELARGALLRLGVAVDIIDEVVLAILATAGHDGDVLGDAAARSRTLSADRAAFADADLAVLGAAAATYEAYAGAIRREYGHLDDETFRRGRAVVLRSFLDRPSIFLTEGGRSRFEATARANLAEELARLASIEPGRL